MSRFGLCPVPLFTNLSRCYILVMRALYLSCCVTARLQRDKLLKILPASQSRAPGLHRYLSSLSVATRRGSLLLVFSHHDPPKSPSPSCKYTAGWCHVLVRRPYSRFIHPICYLSDFIPLFFFLPLIKFIAECIGSQYIGSQ